MDGGLGEDAPPERRLREFVGAFLRRRFDRDRPAWWGKLLAREMRHPCEAVRPVVHKERRENRRLLKSIVSDVLGPDASEETVERCAASVIGQVLHYFHGHHAAPRGQRRGHARARSTGSDDKGMAPETVDELAQHITEFSAGGIARVSARRSGHRAAR